MSHEAGKKAAGEKACSFVEDGMIVGIGTGSTVYYFIEDLIKRSFNGLKVKAVFSSKQSEKLALSGGISCVDINKIDKIDLTVDGADEIDPQFNMIKGGGGALFREKILATSSKEMIVIVDETKIVSNLGQHKLPLEILPFGIQMIVSKVNAIGFHGEIRKNKEGHNFITDNGNLIYDIKLKEKCTNPKIMHQNLIQIPGVVETGLFFDVSKKLIVGYEDGHIEERGIS